MSNKKNREFFLSSEQNTMAYQHVFTQLKEIAVSQFVYENLPATVDKRYFETKLFERGNVVFFYDEVLGYLCLPSALGTGLNVYGIPTDRNIIAANGYRTTMNEENSVIIWNNENRRPSLPDIQMYASRIANIDRAIDVNVNSQKTPILIRCEEKDRLSILNLYKEYEGNAPVIFGDRGLSARPIEVLTTGASYVADRLFQLRSDVWDEALTYLGVPNIRDNKSERLVTSEVHAAQGATLASRFSRLEARENAVKQINDMFGLNIKVRYRGDLIMEQLNNNKDIQNIKEEVDDNE